MSVAAYTRAALVERLRAEGLVVPPPPAPSSPVLTKLLSLVEHFPAEVVVGQLGSGAEDDW
jgi:hypothetical protein